jgi:hypothetical protein
MHLMVGPLSLVLSPISEIISACPMLFSRKPLPLVKSPTSIIVRADSLHAVVNPVPQVVLLVLQAERGRVDHQLSVTVLD